MPNQPVPPKGISAANRFSLQKTRGMLSCELQILVISFLVKLIKYDLKGESHYGQIPMGRHLIITFHCPKAALRLAY